MTKKICLLGDFGVGKTSLVKRFVTQAFSESYITTIGVSIETKTVQFDEGLSIKLIIWDIAGSDSLNQLKVNYLHGSDGYLLVADGTRLPTLLSAMHLKNEADAILDSPPSVMLLNKSDLQEEWELSAKNYAELEEAGIGYFLTSAKNGENVEEAFSRLAKSIMVSSQKHERH